MHLPPDVWLVVLEQLILLEEDVQDEIGWYRVRGSWGSARWRDFTLSSRKAAAYVGRYKGFDVDLPRLLALRTVCKLWRSLVSGLLRDLLMWDVSIDDVDLKNAQRVGFIENLNIVASEEWVFRSQPSRLGRAGLRDPSDSHHAEWTSLSELAELYCRRAEERRAAQVTRFLEAKKHGFPELRRLFDGVQAVRELNVTFTEPGDLRLQRPATRFALDGITAVAHAIRDALRGPAFQNLVELGLDVPSTFFVGELAASMSAEARSRLRRLRFEIVDRTGPGGDYWPAFAGDDMDQPQAGPSATQIAYPNQQHQDAVWEFVGSCRNLESLCIIASHVLDLDRLRWDPGVHHTGLTHIYLERLRTSISTLKKLTKASPRAAKDSATKQVFLHCIEVGSEGGTWQDLFQHLRDACPNLDYLHATELHYSPDHTLWAPKKDIGREMYDVWTDSDKEIDALRDLQWYLHDKYLDYPEKPMNFKIIPPRLDMEEEEE